VRRWTGAGYVAATGMLVAGAVVTSWLLTRGATDALSGLDPEPAAVLAPVESATIDYAADGVLTAVISDGPALPATGLSGTVTAVGVTAGGHLRMGDVAYAVDRVPVVAYSGSAVIFRPILLGTSGPDVVVAQELLSALLPEVELEADGVVGPSTLSAVRQYERSWGASPTGVLQPGWFVYLPSDPFEVSDVSVRVGSPAPARGEPVVTGRATLGQISVTSSSVGPPGAYEFMVQGRAIAVTRDESGAWTVNDPAQAAQVVLAQGGDAHDVTLDGKMRLVDGEAGQAVPGAAIITDGTGATCVFLMGSGEISAGELLSVTVLGSDTTGRAQLAPSLPGDGRVLVNPVQVLGDAICPSS